MPATGALRQVSLDRQFVQIQFSDIATNNCPPESSCKIVTPRTPPLYASTVFPASVRNTATQQQTRHDRSHKRMSYKLIVDRIRRLTRTSSFFARSPVTRG
jgi:hypothetical protein